MAWDRDPQTRSSLIHIVGLPLMLVFCAFLVWGTRYRGVLVDEAVPQGPRPMCRQALSGEGDSGGTASLVLARSTVVVGVAIVYGRDGGSRR